MSKSKNKTKEKRLKKHLHLNIPAELYEKVKKIGLNVSIFVEEALNALISNLDLENTENKPKSGLKSEKGKPQTGFEPVTSSLPRTLVVYFSKTGSESPPIDFGSRKISTPCGGETVGTSKPEMMTISDYFNARIGDDAFLSEFGSSTKFKAYVRCLKNLRDIYVPGDLKRYPEIPVSAEGQHTAPYMTQNHVQGIKHFFTYITKYHGAEEFNGFSLSQWQAFYPDMNNQIGKNTPKEKSMSGHNKDITSEEVREWFNYVRPDMRPWYLLLCYSGARETHLYAALSDPNKKVERLGGKGAKGKYQKLDREILFVDATGTVTEDGKSKKLEFGFMFPVELEYAVKHYLPASDNATTRRGLLSKGVKPPKGLRSVGAANTRKWNTNVMMESGNISGEEIDNIQGRSLNSVRDKNYADTKFKVSNAYAKVVDDMLRELPIPTDIITGESFRTKEAAVVIQKKEEKPRKKNAAAELLKKQGVTKV